MVKANFVKATQGYCFPHHIFKTQPKKKPTFTYLHPCPNE